MEQIFGRGKEPNATPVFEKYRPSERRSPCQKDAIGRVKVNAFGGKRGIFEPKMA